MIDLTTGRFCLAHSMQLLWYTGEVERALYGLPSRAEVAGAPLTDLLCEYHRWYFNYMPIALALRDGDGNFRMHPDNDNVVLCELIGKVVRPQGPTRHDLSKLDLLAILERMEKGLRLLQAERNAGFVHDETTQETLTLDEVIARATLHRDVRDYLASQRTSHRDSTPYTSINLDDPDDRISGEE